MIKQNKKNKSISDKISDLLVPKPLLDPETDPGDETTARTQDYSEAEDEFEIDHRLSEIRKKNIPLLDEVDSKYSGKVASRDDFDDDTFEESESSEEDEDSNVKQKFSMRLKHFDDSSDNETSSKNFENNTVESHGGEEFGNDEDDLGNDENFENGEDSENGEGSEIDDENSENDEEKTDEEDEEDESDFDDGDIFSQSSTNVNETPEVKPPTDNTEIHKSISVQNQLKIWENILEMRIHFQKILIKANSLPSSSQLTQLRESSDELKSLSKETSSNVDNLLSKMCELQQQLVSKFPDTKNLLNKRKRDNIDDSNVPNKLAKHENILQSYFEEYKPYRNEIIVKWHDRTKILTPGNKGDKYPSSSRQDIVQTINDILSNKRDLIHKSQLVKGNYTILDKKSGSKEQSNANEATSNNISENQIQSTEIYDDTDFYHTQLRELIEFKTNSSNNLTEMSKQFAELQKMRNKMKKEVDTRASKGRKIRYAVHNKMVNFMAQNEHSNWTDEAKDELYSSLFGSTNSTYASS